LVQGGAGAPKIFSTVYEHVIANVQRKTNIAGTNIGVYVDDA